MTASKTRKQPLVKRHSQKKNTFLQVIPIDCYCEVSKQAFVYCEDVWHFFIQTIQQLFSDHKFKMNMLYTASDYVFFF